MLPFVIAGLAAGAVLLIAIGVAMSGGSGGVSSRLERYASARGQSEGSDDEEKESVVMAGLSRVMDSQDLSARLGTELARADLKLRPAEFVAFWIACPFVFVAIAFIAGFVIPTLQNPIALVLIFGIGAYFPRWYLGFRQKRRLKAFGQQLPDTITLLA